MEKVGRNDPCPCGSGKKYKQCCMAKEGEAKKTYTSAGKRKFSATVIQSGAMAGGLFQTMAGDPKTSSSYVFLKFKMTDIDYQKEGEPAPIPFAIPDPSRGDFPIPTGYVGEALPLPEVYTLTREDYRIAL